MKLGRRSSGGCAIALLALACFGHSDMLARGQAYYEDNEYERALAVWRELDRSEGALTHSERARYAYFRGMTDYRLGFRDDARHWLAIAKVTERSHPASLHGAWLKRLDGALGDLERQTLGIRANGRDPVQIIEAPPVQLRPLESPPSHPALESTPPPPQNIPPETSPPAEPSPAEPPPDEALMEPDRGVDD